MQVNRISNISCNNQPNFGMYDRVVYNKYSHRYMYNTTTWFARSDLNWVKFIDFVINKYKNVDKVNTIVHACSNGEEAYTLTLGLLSKKNTSKFFPISARDIDKENITQAVKGVFELKLKSELEGLLSLINEPLETYFKKTLKPDKMADLFSVSKQSNIASKIILEPKDNLRSVINFRQSDIFRDYRDIPSENTILMLRNVWPYLGGRRDILVKDLANHLKSSSTLVIGMYDRTRCVDRKLLAAGFKKTPLNYVFEKA